MEFQSRKVFQADDSAQLGAQKTGGLVQFRDYLIDGLFILVLEEGDTDIGNAKIVGHFDGVDGHEGWNFRIVQALINNLAQFVLNLSRNSRHSGMKHNKTRGVHSAQDGEVAAAAANQPEALDAGFIELSLPFQVRRRLTNAIQFFRPGHLHQVEAFCPKWRTGR